MKYLCIMALFLGSLLFANEHEDLKTYTTSALADVLLGKTTENKVRYCEEILSRDAEEINCLSSFQLQIIAGVCSSNKRLWMRYIAGYMQLHHKELKYGASEAQAMDGIQFAGISFEEQMNLGHRYQLINPQRFDNFIAGFIPHYEKKSTTAYWFKLIPYTQENTKMTYIFRLIDEGTGIVLLDKNVGSLFDPEVRRASYNKNRVEILSKGQVASPIINLGHYYEALKLYPKASINDYIFYMRYASKQYYDWNIQLTSA